MPDNHTLPLACPGELTGVPLHDLLTGHEQHVASPVRARLDAGEPKPWLTPLPWTGSARGSTVMSCDTRRGCERRPTTGAEPSEPRRAGRRGSARCCTCSPPRQRDVDTRGREGRGSGALHARVAPAGEPQVSAPRSRSVRIPRCF